MPEKRISEILMENKQLASDSANYLSYIQDLADYILPRKAWMTSIRTKGERVKFNFLYDSTAIRALRTMSAGFHSNLTNPSSRWFALETKNKELMDDLEVRDWFRRVEENLYGVLNSSNFYNVIQEFYTDFGGFGTGTFLMLEDHREVIRFTSIAPKEPFRVVDANGRLSAIYRNFRLSARQSVQLWGRDSGKSVVETVEKKPFEMMDFLHYVGPRHVRDVNKANALNMPFESVWIAVKDEHLIKESGFQEMPYMSEVFYHDSEDPNGFSPAMDVFADIKLVNAMQRTIIRAGMKASDPPIQMPSQGFMLPLNLNPGAVNYRESKTPHDSLQAMPVGQGRVDLGIDLIKMVQESIEKGMFVPLFRALAEITKQMTIPEVQRRVAENMVLLGPVINRATHGVLDPMIIRLFNIQVRNGMLPDPPEAIQGKEFFPVYLSPLAKAQKSSEVLDMQSFLNDVSAIGSVIPQAFDKIDEDKTIDVLARMRGINPEIMRDDESIERIRRHREEQNQMIAALQAGREVAGIAKDGAQYQAAVGAGQ